MTKEIRLDIDEGLHRKVKATSALEGKSIKGMIIEFLEGYINDNLPTERTTKFGKGE